MQISVYTFDIFVFVVLFNILGTLASFTLSPLARSCVFMDKCLGGGGGGVLKNSDLSPDLPGL